MFDQIRADLAIVRERDPAARNRLEILFCYPGFHAITLHRFSHRLWCCDLKLKLLARFLSQIGRISHIGRITLYEDVVFGGGCVLSLWEFGTVGAGSVEVLRR